MPGRGQRNLRTGYHTRYQNRGNGSQTGRLGADSTNQATKTEDLVAAEVDIAPRTNGKG